MLAQLLSSMQEWGASDLFLTEGVVPAIRMHGCVQPLAMPATTSEEMEGLLSAFLGQDASERLHASGDVDVGYSLPSGQRFRINVFKQRAVIGMVARAIPSGALTFHELHLPDAVRALADAPRGLVLVTGATGSGKSTTLAAMIHHINSTRPAHIITLEDPIEYLHTDQQARITQREIGSDSLSFQAALRHVVRQSPDVIMVGELRDRETMEVAMAAALTGHLVLASLHTIDAPQTLQRIVGLAPEHLRAQAALDLSLSLQGIVSQRLLPRADLNGRVVAVEVLTFSPAVSRLVHEQKWDDLVDFMRQSSDAHVTTFDRALVDLYRQGAIAYDVGRAHASNPDEFGLSAKGMETGIATFRRASTGFSDGQLDIKSMLAMAVERGASDLHLASGRPPIIRVSGQLEPLAPHALTTGDMRTLLYSILNARQRSTYEIEREIDFALALENGQRFRVNAYFQKGNMAAALRAISTRIPDANELGLPDTIQALATKSQGLMLVVGPTGAGKTTTLACLVDRINRSRPCRILTIEDPIEYIHESKLATVDQREVSSDTLSFAAALKYVLRQDPDVIMVGEMRDIETISAALTAAETGHLVLATLHTNDAAQAIDRIIDVFPPLAQGQVRSQLAATLLAVVSQRLLRRKGAPGRIGVFEILVGTMGVRALIRDNKMHQAMSMIETQRNEGMVSMNHAVKDLLDRGLIERDEALLHMRAAMKIS